MSLEADWSAEKNADIKRRYGFGFERIMVALADGDLVDIRAHPNAERYPHQKQLLVRIDGYVWVVPFVQNEDTVFLKTIFPSRKATREFLETRR